MINSGEDKEKHESDLYGFISRKNLFSDVLNCTANHKRKKGGKKFMCSLNSESADSCIINFGLRSEELQRHESGSPVLGDK